jgi:hypothetical protein
MAKSRSYETKRSSVYGHYFVKSGQPFIAKQQTDFQDAFLFIAN